MHNIWHIAYEVSRYTGYSFFRYDNSRDAIWLKDSKKRALMCLSSVYIAEEELDEEMYYLENMNHLFSKDMDISLIESYHMAEEKHVKKYRQDGTKIIQKGITDAKSIVNNPFFRMDLQYKKPKDAGYYQRRLMSRHPFEKFMIKFTPMTYLLVCINLLVFLFNLAAIHLWDSYNLTYMMALSHYNVIAGDFYRLLSSSFLHITVDHFLFNIFALYILGKFVESIFGGWRLLIAYVITGVTSSLFSLMFVTEGISLGASGAVYGLLAIIVVHLLVNGRLSTRLLIQIAAVFIVVSLFSQLISNVNHYAHVGGLLFGALLGVLYHPKKFSSKWHIIALALLIGLSVLSFMVMHQKESSHPLTTQAMEYIDEGEYDAALDILNQSIRTNNETAATYHALGLIAEYHGNMEQARHFHNISWELDPDAEQVARHRLMQLRKERNYEEMARILGNFNTETIDDPQLKQIAEEFDNG
ncbi:rhomboid family intramembrane serine protease [Salinicoccus roseus]|uniref:rhomboid family intramembrane serine protease n=1 Tax=Salinicoccus roseus TaxID=45670 RepID=UPI0022FFD5A4|nr:rhomboid family intramembrane serine protease [Salinicoccus roseus]